MRRLPEERACQGGRRELHVKPPVPFLWHCSGSCKIRAEPTPCFYRRGNASSGRLSVSTPTG